MRSSSGRGLRPNVLGTFDTVVMAVAGSAPAYSIAATTAVLGATVGLAGPAALLYCAIPMLGIVLAFGRLGRIDVNAGAGYSWVGRTLHPFLGFLSGWALVVSTTIFMVAGSLPAGAMTLALLDPDLADDRFLATAVGAAWFLAMLLVVLGGARLTVRAQLLLTGTELAILLFFVGAAVLHEGAATAFDWSWFGFSHFDGPAGFASGALIATFYYWGWDVTGNLSEETRNSRRTAGLAALVGVGIVFLLFEAFTIAVNVVLTSGEIQAAGANVPAVFGAAIWPGRRRKAAGPGGAAVDRRHAGDHTDPGHPLAVRDGPRPDDARGAGSGPPPLEHTLGGRDGRRRGRPRHVRGLHGTRLRRRRGRGGGRRDRPPDHLLLRARRDRRRRRVPPNAAGVRARVRARRRLAAAGRAVHAVDLLRVAR
jgi:hypothetical protein